MKRLYVINMKNAEGIPRLYNVVASSLTNALNKCCTLAGVPEGTEPESIGRGQNIDAEAD